MVEFYAEWCTWCQRLETDTLTDREVRNELEQLVALKLNAETDGQAAAERFEIETYPTMVFLDAKGDEIERIVGYLPPEKFVAEIRRIRRGDTLFACLDELRDDPANVEAIKRAVKGLLERSDPEGAIAKIKSFHANDEHAHAVCQRLMFRAGRDLHYRVYLRAGKLYRDGWRRPIDVPPVPGVENLHQLMAAGLINLPADEQAKRMREARFDDASALLEFVDLEKVSDGDLFGIAEFAFRGGHYEVAAELYKQWFEDAAQYHDSDSLNRAARQLYLARENVDTAIQMALSAFKSNPSTDVADTLARLLYLHGNRDQAIMLANRAADVARDSRAEGYRAVASRMETGLDLEDRPEFETYPLPDMVF
jgi:tetratricopeptide (TPR) repeat protein